MLTTFRLIGIDPGSNTGVAIYHVDAMSMDIVKVETVTYSLNNIAPLADDFQLSRVMALAGLCGRLQEYYSPIMVALEAAFMNSRFPKAVMQLSQYTSVVEQSFISRDPFVKLVKMAPKYIKKYIGGGGNANKDGMTIAVSNIKEISDKVDLNALTEHEIDALAIGYVALTHVRQYPHVLISY